MIDCPTSLMSAGAPVERPWQSRAERSFGKAFFAAILAITFAPIPLTTAAANPAITTFNQWCFKAGQTESQARANMNADTAPFTLTFWDDSLEPRPANAPQGVERRCQVTFKGNHTTAAITALRTQMATPPVFGTPIPLPKTHQADAATVLIEGRELLRGRVAVVQIGTENNQTRTYMAVDRLYDGLGLPD